MSPSLNRREFLGTLAAAGALAIPAAPAVKEPWGGAFIIMQTPFLESLEVDAESLKRETEFLVKCGVQGMVWPAGAGETAELSHDERVKFARVVVDQARGRTPVLIGVHAPNKFEAAEYAREAERMGADGMLAMSQTDGSNDPGHPHRVFHRHRQRIEAAALYSSHQPGLDGGGSHRPGPQTAHLPLCQGRGRALFRNASRAT